MARLTDISKMKICKSTEIQSAGGGFGMLKILSGETPVQQDAVAGNEENYNCKGRNENKSPWKLHDSHVSPQPLYDLLTQDLRHEVGSILSAALGKNS